MFSVIYQKNYLLFLLRLNAFVHKYFHKFAKCFTHLENTYSQQQNTTQRLWYKLKAHDVYTHSIKSEHCCYNCALAVSLFSVCFYVPLCPAQCMINGLLTSPSPSSCSPSHIWSLLSLNKGADA